MAATAAFCSGTREAGVQQGDPLGPLLFALALHPALQAARAGPAPPSLALAFLDNVCLAGDYRHVAASLARLAAAARQVGLELNPSKCELVVCSGADHCVDTSLFPAGVQVNSRGAFSFLGAPIGPPAYCEAFCLAERVEKAKPLLALLATLPDPQTALLLLRHCASFCRVAYSARVTPPSLHCNALAVFDGAVRACLESVCTGPLAAEAWVQCTLATSVGGLGLRLARRHAPAAYIASLVSTAASGLALDPGYDLANHSAYLASVTAHNQDVMPSDHLPVPVPPNTRQRQLSQALDRAVVAQLLAPGQGREAARAHFHLLQQPGAGAWLHAPPSEALGLHVVPRLFRVMVQLRLRLAVVPTDAACPLCDGVADRFGDHSRSCPCGGDRVKRHNRLRSIVAARARAAGLMVELLPLRPEDDGVNAGGRGAGQRRPADVWVAQWGLHGAAAFDIAVTSGLCAGAVLAESACSGSAAVEAYEARKRTYLHTEQHCSAEGLQFFPLVAEACGGGWGPTAIDTWRTLGGLLAARSGDTPGAETDRLLQSLAVTLQRENARAVLRRLPVPAEAQAAFAEP